MTWPGYWVGERGSFMLLWREGGRSSQFCTAVTIYVDNDTEP